MPNFIPPPPPARANSAKTAPNQTGAKQTGRSGGDRTPNLRFWRPALYQLSYTPPAPVERFLHFRTRGNTRGDPAKPSERIRAGSICLQYLQKTQISVHHRDTLCKIRNSPYSMISATTPAPTVRPPSRMAKRRPLSMAMGTMRSTTMVTLSPGMIISVPSGNSMVPVTSVVRK